MCRWWRALAALVAATWTSTCLACGGIFRDAAGTITSPEYPEAYPHNANCVYTILVSVEGRGEIRGKRVSRAVCFRICRPLGLWVSASHPLKLFDRPVRTPSSNFPALKSTFKTPVDAGVTLSASTAFTYVERRK